MKTNYKRLAREQRYLIEIDLKSGLSIRSCISTLLFYHGDISPGKKIATLKSVRAGSTGITADYSSTQYAIRIK